MRLLSSSLAAAAAAAKKPDRVKLPKRKGEYLYGYGPCLAALQAGRRRVHRAYVQEGFEGKKQSEKQREVYEKLKKRMKNREDELMRVDKLTLDRVTMNKPHQGIVLDADPLPFKQMGTTSLKCGDSSPVWLALHQVQDPMNLGAILRCAYFFSVDRVLTSARCCPLSPVVSKASAGAMEVMPVYSVTKMPTFLEEAVSSGWDVLGTVGSHHEAPRREVVSCYDYVPKKPTILLLGNEGHGLHYNILSACTSLITVHPLRSLPVGFDSLNVSVATGLLLSCLQRNKTEEIC